MRPRPAANRCIKIAIVHDVAESIVGDITPHCKVTPDEKEALEARAVERIQQMLGADTRAAADIAALWREYEDGATPEAQLVKDFDKLEMIVQAHEYEQATPGMALQEFFDSTAGKWRTPLGAAWAAELVARREAAAVADIAATRSQQPPPAATSPSPPSTLAGGANGAS